MCNAKDSPSCRVDAYADMPRIIYIIMYISHTNRHITSPEGAPRGIYIIYIIF